MIKKKLYLLGLYTSILFSQNIWTGTSVATSDNLDAFSLNPAGFGIDRGQLSGSYIPINNDRFDLIQGVRSGTFGYLTKFTDSRPIEVRHQPISFKIGQGFKVGKSSYIGILWNQEKIGEGDSMNIENNFTFGAIVRPWNCLSIGGTFSANEEHDISNNRIGIALRPFSNHRLTLGLDYQTNSDLITSELTGKNMLYPSLDLKVIDGINIGFSTAINLDDSNTKPQEFQINLGFNFDKGGSYTIADDRENIGIGMYTSEQILPSIFGKKKKDSKHYLRMKLSGPIIEENPSEGSFFSNILFSSARGTQLRTWIERMDEYTNNPDIDGLIIDISSVGGGFAKKNEMRRALQRFKDKGKEIIVYSEYGLSGGSYYLISMADKIFLGNNTGVDLKGINIEVSFYRTLLDSLSIVPEVFRVNYDGKSYKTMGDSFLYSEMTDEFRENYTDLFQGLYDIFSEGIALGRGWSIDETKKIIDAGPYFLTGEAKNAGLIDSTMFKDQYEDYLSDLNDGENTITKIANLDNSDPYSYEWTPEKKDQIAVIYAVGGIMPGTSNPGPSGSSTMGDKTIMKAIKDARTNENIKAIVLRIDSGGGSVLASDNMWREVYKTTTEDTTNVKPFIASMSDVAASGGYYIAMEADSILADEATITGSIGVIGLSFNTSKLMKRIGVNTESITFGENADFATTSRLISEDDRNRVQQSINESYDEFKQKITDGRYNISEEDDLDAVAMGRVFTGSQAANLDLFLVDKLGGIHEAIEVAKNAAGIDGEVLIVEYPEKEKMSTVLNLEFGFKSAVEHNIVENLPQEFKKHYDAVELMHILASDDKHMILPYKIEIK